MGSLRFALVLGAIAAVTGAGCFGGPGVDPPTERPDASTVHSPGDASAGSLDSGAGADADRGDTRGDDGGALTGVSDAAAPPSPDAAVDASMFQTDDAGPAPDAGPSADAGPAPDAGRSADAGDFDAAPAIDAGLLDDAGDLDAPPI